MTVTPQGNIYLCKTKLENDYKNQLTFSNLTAQLNYFNSTIQHTFDNYTYVKKDSKIKVGANIDSIIDCNYLFYKNTGFTTKYYFCFIKNMEYINESCTAITIETDCFQTWQFQIHYHKCFVEREHVNDDTIGLHTIDEGLACNNFKNLNVTIDPYYLQDPYIVVMSTYDLETDSDMSGSTIWNGVVTGAKAYIFRFKIQASSYGVTDFEKFLLATNIKGKKDAIQNIFIVPCAVLGLEPSERWHTT